MSTVTKQHVIQIFCVTRKPKTVYEHLTRFYMKYVLKHAVTHCMLLLDETLYGLTLNGVEALPLTHLVPSNVSVVIRSKWYTISEFDFWLINERISCYAKAGGKLYILDFLRYPMLQLLRRKYTGRPLCTGFVETILGMDVTNSLPLEVMRSYEKLKTLA